MRILGVDLTREPASAGPAEHTLVMLDADGRIVKGGTGSIEHDSVGAKRVATDQVAR